MREVIPLFAQHAFMACSVKKRSTETTLPLPSYFILELRLVSYIHEINLKLR